ncbi:magnesium transporter MgtE N-terminal domain-containing protein [Candidatus Magnetobacterium casense]|uniref:Magnesium transporter n=1 Tax=Candidatus Magnetobacterium casense TaxID=1455061 RepID=A0ABS6S248_9BACT|nr:CBS domain-containing protein [Candidatus Magnetobacterium casensis]MBV6342919.1 magnesium transporter [Candidatus Magnetobacterium casensis]
MPLFGEIFLSEILHKPVFDMKGEELGKIHDVLVVKGETLPRIEALVIKSRDNFYRVDYKSLSIFNRRMMTTTLQHDNLPGYDSFDADLLAARDVLDKQIVDINGAKVVRVNDIKIEGYRNWAVLVAIDVGMRGLLRRLGVEKKAMKLLTLLKLHLPESLIRWDYLQPLSPRLKSISLKVTQKLAKIHPADLADIISSVSRAEGESFFRSLDVESAAETLSELESGTQVEILSNMAPEKAAAIIEEMAPDDAVDILSDLPKDKTKQILDSFEQEDVENIHELLSHEEDTAGGLMKTEFLLYSSDTKVREVIERFKTEAHDVETIYYLYVADKYGVLIGVVSLKDMLLSDGEMTLASIMSTNIKSVRPDDDEDIVAAKISKYNLVAIPVVDDDGQMVGLVTVDDIVDRILPPSARRKRKKI